MISISLTSGMLPRFFLSLVPKSFVESTSGTSSGGSFHAAFPAPDFSKTRPSFWLTCRVALRVICFTASPPAHLLLSCCASSVHRRRPPQPRCQLRCVESARYSTRARHCPVLDRSFSTGVRPQSCVPEDGY